MLTFVKESDDEDHLRGETHDPDSGVAHGAPAGLHWSNWGENAQVSIAAACCIWRPIDLEPNGCKIWQLTCFLRPTLWENWTTLKEWIFSLQETDFLEKSSMNIFGTYPNFHISVTQEGLSNKITFTIQHGLKSLLWHSAPCHVFAYTCLYIHIHAPIFLTIPHFDWGSWGNTFGPTKVHHFARKM